MVCALHPQSLPPPAGPVHRTIVRGQRVRRSRPRARTARRRAAEEGGERAAGAGGVREAVEEVGADRVILGDVGDRDEILALQVLNQRVRGVVAARRALERLARQAEGAAEGVGGGNPRPLLRPLCDRVADAAEGGAVRVPDAAAGEAHAGLQVEVEAGRVRVLTRLVAEVGADVGLVGRLVLGEARVPVDAEERAAVGPGVGAEVRADLGQRRGEGLDEVEHGVPHLRPVARLVRLEPGPARCCP